MSKLTTFEESALVDEDVKFGFDNYDVLKKIGDVMREMREQSAMSQVAVQEASGISQGDISRVETGSMERGPSILTLIRLAHSTGKRLVIGIEDADDEGHPTRLMTF
jgi:transcriptional regulator with XRE-family HTH domain